MDSGAQNDAGIQQANGVAIVQNAFVMPTAAYVDLIIGKLGKFCDGFAGDYQSRDGLTLELRSNFPKADIVLSRPSDKRFLGYDDGNNQFQLFDGPPYGKVDSVV